MSQDFPNPQRKAMFMRCLSDRLTSEEVRQRQAAARKIAAAALKEELARPLIPASERVKGE